MITAVQWAQSSGTAAALPADAPAPSPMARYAAMAMCCSFLSFAPSRCCEISGRMAPFLAWHSVWHYAPNAFAVAWLMQTAR